MSEAPYSSYTIKKLQDDLERTTEWLADEEERMAKTSDEHIKGIFKIRTEMYRRNVAELTQAIAAFEAHANGN